MIYKLLNGNHEKIKLELKKVDEITIILEEIQTEMLKKARVGLTDHFVTKY